MKLTVCILTAGLGSRMGERGNILNKALFPVDNKPIITHIIEKFPSNTEFVIALGYKGKQVKSFLKLFHSKNKFIFVNIKIYWQSIRARFVIIILQEVFKKNLYLYHVIHYGIIKYYLQIIVIG